jgi:signal transduction histidine kinase
MYKNEVTALLQIDLSSGDTLSHYKRKVLDRALVEISQAITNFQLQCLLESQTEAVENERSRIARDLHDTLAQTIGYLRLKLDQFSEAGSQLKVADIQGDIVRMRDAAEEAHEQIRGTLADLEPVCLTDLATTLHERALVLGERQGFAIHMDRLGEPLTISPEVQRQVLYICRETLNNVGRHANAQEVDIQLQWGKDHLSLSIADDGFGFDTGAVPAGDHLGLSIMKQRAQELNGRITIRSSPGNGTEVFLWLPTAYTLGEAIAEPL